MITTAALAAAGPGAHLVARPRGVPHVYVGPLTPSGRWVPAHGKTVCRARTRRLSVIERPGHPLDPDTPALCARCSACLASPVGRQAERPRSREDHAGEYAALTPWDLSLDLAMAETLDEIERIEWLSLLLLGYPACATQPVLTPDGRALPSLDTQLRHRRAELGLTHELLTDAPNADYIAEVRERIKAERRATWREREDRIARIGYVNATTHERARRDTTLPRRGEPA